MATIEVSIIINRPIDEVFSYVVEPEKQGHWQASLVESSADGQLQVGTQITQVRQFLGREIGGIYQVTEYEPFTKFGAKTVSGPVETTGGYTFSPVSGGTKVTSVAHMNPGGAFRAVESLFAGMVKRTTEADLETLKELLESRN